MTKELEKRFAEVGEQIHSKNPLIICKRFTPDSNRTWLVSEFYPESQACYGYVVGNSSERGYFSLEEIRRVKGAYGLGVERDLRFRESLFLDLGL